MIFRQLFDPASSTYTYLLGDAKSGVAVVIDPVFEQVRRDAALISELGLELAWSLETHVHADHVTAGWLLRERTGCKLALAEAAGPECADRALAHGDRIAFGARYLEVRATPGHTNGCLTYVLDDWSRAFTGDCLLVRGSGRTDFQQGDARLLYRSVHAQIFSLPKDCLLYPAHDYRGLTATTVEEERHFNPRLGGAIGEEDFAGFMRNMSLPHPKKIDLAVPANLKCGRPADVGAAEAAADPAAAEQDWAPLTYTFAGIWEIQPETLEEQGNRVQILDVREADEFSGPLGHIEGAMLIPLGELARRTSELGRDRPIVAVCRSGARSAQALTILRQAGLNACANLAGGMLRWRADGRAVEAGKSLG
ncbi:MAG TPA: rhodanese-like domain-containing protein [Alphaproteobacteria bacterium]|nr:rhodanese-like domain-containing protein [Alphaproteobacteria bacterium]